MTSPVTPSVPAGWYPDPAGGARSRWWDGTQWTEHFQEPYDPAAAAAALKAPEGTQWNTPWIWLVVLLPYITLPFLFSIDFTGMFTAIDPNDPSSAMAAQLSFLTSPAYILLSVGGFLTSALTIFFAYRDWRALETAGVPKPFHWAWVFFNLAGYPVYAIGRAVVTKRRTGHGSAVLWVTIGMLVLAFVVVIAWTIVIMAAMMQTFSGLYGN